jgi:hypothetical protein
MLQDLRDFVGTWDTDMGSASSGDIYMFMCSRDFLGGVSLWLFTIAMENCHCSQVNHVYPLFYGG